MVKSTPLVPFLATAALLLTTASATLDPIVIKGSKFFFKSNGTQFFMKGVAYQAGFSPSTSGAQSASSTKFNDPLADEASCTRDVPYLQKLGANTIRTYAIDPTKDHDKCMKLLDDAGIYVISDLSEPSQSIDRDEPQWTTPLFDRYSSVIDTLSKYPNVIGFFAGNEVANNITNTKAASMVKAAVRDMKAYIKAKNYRQLYVGYAADDDQTVRAQSSAYFNCGDAASAIDFWGYNIYEWCGESSFETSGYSKRVEEFSSYSVPSFFAEFGCNNNGAANRPWTEVAALLGNQMTPTFSGGIAFEFFEETNDFGLVSVSGSSISTLKDFAPLATQYHAATPTGVEMAKYSPSNTAQACPPVASNWFSNKVLPPTPNKSVCSCMMASLSCAAKADVDTTKLGTLFGQVCAHPGACSGISRNITTGAYGPYSMCNATEQLSNAFNAYYNSLSAANKANGGCDFGGAAQSVTPAAAASTCSSVLSSASAAAPTGDGTGADVNSGSGTSGTGSGTGASPSGSGAASSTTKKSEGAMIHGATLGMGPIFAVGFTLLAAFSGAGMILL